MGTNPRVAAAATRKNGIRLDELTLIGIFGTATSRRALVRHSSGRVQKVRLGTRLQGRRVVAIAPDRLILQSGSGRRELAMPTA